MGYEMNDYSEVAQRVWETDVLEEKKEILLNAVQEFKFKGSKEKHIKLWTQKIEVAGPERIDAMAANLALNKDLKVI